MSNGTLPKAVGMQAYRAPSLFQPHRARDAIADAHAGKIAPLLGYIMGFSSIQVARVVAQFGYDWAWIDWEHNPMDLETMTTVRPPHPSPPPNPPTKSPTYSLSQTPLLTLLSPNSSSTKSNSCLKAKP